MDSVALVWEKYFESRVLRHAYSRVAAHQLLYKRLLSRMLDSAAEAILAPQEHAYQFLEAQLRRVHAMNAHNPAYLEILKGLGEELALVQNSTGGTGLMLALKATAAARRRRAPQIRVQPTSIARCRPGLTRGSKRILQGAQQLSQLPRGQRRDPILFTKTSSRMCPVQGCIQWPLTPA
ncbi:hypothetical protein MTO96_050989 [Rhipicephalus appendiculatus]